MAGRLSDAWLDDLRGRLDIVDVVSDYVALKQKGRRFWGLCPFHNEKTASFSVDPEAQMYYCFGCHEGGHVIHFVMQLERMEFMEAVTLLAERAHLPLPERREFQGAPSRELKERIYAANRAAARYYHELLYAPEGAQALAYLHRRGLDDSDIRRFGLGASPEGWTELTKALMEDGFTEEELINAGLTGKKDQRAYDMFRGRVMFPIISAQGHVLGFGGRALGDATPKYLNTSDTPVFNKRQGLYALNMVRKEGRHERLILVEGYMDVVSLYKAGATGVVATLGTAFTEEQARLIKRYAPEVWLSYDGDAAGQKAILRALTVCERQDVRARVLVFPEGQDPDDFIRASGLAGFHALKPADPVAYRMNSIRAEYDLADERARQDYAIACCELLKSVRNPVELQGHVERLMMDTGFPREVLLDQIGVQLSKPEPGRPKTRGAPKTPKFQDYERAEMTLLALLSSALIPMDAVRIEDFDTELFKTVAARLLMGERGAKILDSLDDEERKLASTALIMEVPPDEKHAMAVADDCLRTIQLHKIESRISELQEQLKTAEGAAKAELIQQTMQLTQESNRLKTGRKG